VLVLTVNCMLTGCFTLSVYFFTSLISVEVMFSNKALQVILHAAICVVVTACVILLINDLIIGQHAFAML